MAGRRLIWQLYPLYIIVMALALAAIVVHALFSFGEILHSRTASELENTALLAGRIISQSVGDRPAIDVICKEAGRAVGKRITVILLSGEVAGDTDEDPGVMENHADRPEVKEALAGNTGVATRRSHTLGRDMMYVALPVMRDGRVVAVVRASMPMTVLTDLLRRLDLRIAVEGAIVAIIAGIAVLVLSRKRMKPLEEIRFGAMRFLEGDLSYRLRVKGPAEVASLADTMNRIAAELSDRMNRLKELENIRRDFVANVSHELKTPVTSIRGFAETLRDGAIEEPERAKKYLEIIASHAGRLSSIIDDLLILARMEETRDVVSTPVTVVNVREVIDAAIEVCMAKASEKKIKLEFSCDDGLFANINAPLMEQAVINLIDNAIKYSGEGSSVNIKAIRDGDDVKIVVEDCGPGISEEHLDRIFERFYRVDKGRSRQLGGTGLGLAIVKHIAGVHNGSVSVTSRVGHGSSFIIKIPSLPNHR